MIDRSEKAIQLFPPIRGFNSKDPPHHLPEGQGVEAWNVEIDEVIGINKRLGYAAFNTASALIPRYNAGTIKEITGAMVYGSGVVWTASVCKGSDVIFLPGNSSPIFWQIATCVGTATLSLAVAYSQTVTASTYILGPKEVTELVNYKYGTSQKLVAFAGQDLFYATAGLTGSFTKVAAALTDYQGISWTLFQDKLIFCNGYEFKYYDGSTVSAISGSPDPSDPKYVGLYTIGNANFVWVGGSNTDAKKSQFAFSDVNAMGTWPSANIYYAGDRDGGKITGGKPIPGGWAIFKDNGIFIFSGIPGSGSLRKVVGDVGCVADYSLVEDEGYIYFIGKRSGKLGAFRFDGNTAVCLSDSIEPSLSSLDFGTYNKITAKIYDNKYVISTTSASGGANNRHFVCYIRQPFEFAPKIYFPWVRGNRGWRSLSNVDVSGVNYLFSGSPTNGFVYIEDYGNSDDTTDNIFGNTSAISAYVDTAWMDMGTIGNLKDLTSGYLDATESGDWKLNFKLYKDFQTYGFDSYSFNLGGTILTWAEVIYGQTVWQTARDKSIHQFDFNYPSVARHFKFRWQNDNAGEPFTVYPMTILYKLESE